MLDLASIRGLNVCCASRSLSSCLHFWIDLNLVKPSYFPFSARFFPIMYTNSPEFISCE